MRKVLVFSLEMLNSSMEQVHLKTEDPPNNSMPTQSPKDMSTEEILSYVRTEEIYFTGSGLGR
jgi:hypothetical protein